MFCRLRTTGKYVLATTGALFTPQAPYGISQGGAKGLSADGQQGDEQGAGGSRSEDPPRQWCAIGEVLEPVAHRPARQGEGDTNSEAYQ